jgi:hypothetical protein
MPRLRSCYFCGTVGDALEAYEVVPARLIEGEAQSAVLCPDCHRKLRQVIEPLVTAPTDVTGGDASPHQEVTFDSAGAGGHDADASETGDDTDPGRDTDGDDPANGRADDPANGRADDPANGRADDPGDDADVPDGYYKVLRLLQNREFPMDRAELTTLVTGAYDVTEPECERILDAAIERGVLVQDGTTLDLGRN